MLAYGEAKRGKYGAEMIHPEYRVQGDLSTPELQETLTPVYPTTEGIKQATLRKLTDQALELLDTCAITELLPRAGTGHDEPARGIAHTASSTTHITAQRFRKRQTSRTTASYP